MIELLRALLSLPLHPKVALGQHLVPKKAVLKDLGKTRDVLKRAYSDFGMPLSLMEEGKQRLEGSTTFPPSAILLGSPGDDNNHNFFVRPANWYVFSVMKNKTPLSLVWDIGDLPLAL